MRAATALAITAAVLVNASPYPQGVTSHIAPSGSAPSGCSLTYTSFFGLSVQKAGSELRVQHDMHRREARPQVVTSISDGQVQAPTTVTVVVSVPSTTTITSASSSGSASSSSSVSASSTGPGPFSGTVPSTVTITASGSTSATSTTTVTLTNTVTTDCSSTSVIPVTQISDGQVQATNTTPSPAPPTIVPDPTTVTNPVSQISDGQVQGPPTRKAIAPRHVLEVSEEDSLKAHPIVIDLAPAASTIPYTCETNNTLSINLNDGVLKDHHGRTGYIASNYQFQFDGPPQHGALYTAGFSVCSNGSLALGGSTVFWECLSGNFMNIYDRYWAHQCSPIELVMTKLVEC